MTSKKIFVLLAVLLIAAAVFIAGDIQAAVRCNSNNDCGSDKFIKNSTWKAQCRGNDVYQFYKVNTCHNPGTEQSTCTTDYDLRFVKTCSQGQECKSHGTCVGDVAGDSQPPQDSCLPNQYTQCVGNSVYWYNSCGQVGQLYQNCSVSGQVCQVGQCVASQPQPQPQPYPYIQNYITQCYAGNAYWYDNYGNRQGLFKNCQAIGAECGNGQCFAAQTPTSAPAPTETPDETEQEPQQEEGEPEQTKTDEAAAAVSESGLSFNRWYIWLAIAIILIILFIVIFRRLSSTE